MRFLLLLLLSAVSGVCHAGYDPLGLASATAPDRASAGKVLDYDPLGLNAPAVKPTAPSAPEVPFCITVDGVDYDLDTILSEYRSPWTWPGTDERSLRLHLSSNGHSVTGLDGLDFAALKKVHSVLHEREGAVAASKTKQVPKAVPAAPKPPQAKPRATSPCPGGVCPQPQQYYQQPKKTGLLRRLFGG